MKAADEFFVFPPELTEPSEEERQLALYRKAINDIDDRIEYTEFTKADIYAILADLTDGLAGKEPIPYRLTDAGRALLEGK